jgi:hypothetical protein
VNALTKAHEAIDRLAAGEKCIHTQGDPERISWCGACEDAAIKEAHAALEEAVKEAKHEGASNPYCG